MYVFSLVYIFSASFGSAVDKRTKNNQILGLCCGLFGRLTRQWIKERRISYICVKSKVSISSGSFGTKEQTSNEPNEPLVRLS